MAIGEGSGSSSAPKKNRSTSLCGPSSSTGKGIVHPKVKKISDSTKFKHSGRPPGDLGGVPVCIRGGVCTRIPKKAPEQAKSGFCCSCS